MLVVSAPTRLDFGGGWTDVPPYPEERGGFVCNLAIERRATVTLYPTGSPELVGDVDALVRAGLARAGRDHWHAAVHSDFPVAAGLGGSSAAGVALAAAIARANADLVGPAELAERSRAVEVETMGIAGGRQDHYAAAFGGALGLTFGETTQVEQIPLPPHVVSDLEQRLTVIYTGESRISAETITAVLDGYAARTRWLVAALDRMALLARGMRAALHAGDVRTLAHLIDEHWVHQKSLHPRITTPRIDAIERAVRAAGATGFKALGASGGGCVLALSDPDHAAAVQAAAHPLGQVLPWRVAHTGVRVESLGAAH